MGQRATKPTKLRAIEGNRGKRDLPDNEPKPIPKAPQCPVTLSPEAQEVWLELAPKIERIGLLAETDGDAFANLCVIVSRLRVLRQRIEEEGTLVVGKIKIMHTGEEHIEFVPSAYVVMEKQYMKDFRAYAGEFGLTPRGRVGLTAGTKADGGGMEDLLD